MQNVNIFDLIAALCLYFVVLPSAFHDVTSITNGYLATLLLGLTICAVNNPFLLILSQRHCNSILGDPCHLTFSQKRND